MDAKCEDVLIALRQIMRATDLHSKRLKKASGLTTPQLLVLQSIRDMGEVTIGMIAEHVNLSHATVTAVLDRLEAQKLVYRKRSDQDRRKVHAYLTKKGAARLADAPTPLQEEFIASFSSLADWEQNLVLSALQRTAVMMNAEHISASPVLEVAAIVEATNDTATEIGPD